MQLRNIHFRVEASAVLLLAVGRIVALLMQQTREN